MLLFIPMIMHAGVIRGLVQSSNEPLPFASVYVKNSTRGTVTNLKGLFELELDKGTYTIVYSFVGYKTLEKTYSLTSSNEINDTIILKEDNTLGEVQVYSDQRDRAKEIMAEVRKLRSDFNKGIEYFKCESYIKTSIDKKVKLDPDSFPNNASEISYSKDLNQFFKQENLNLIESFSTTYYDRPNKFKEEFHAYHDYSETKSEIGQSISFGVELGEEEIAPEPAVTSNPLVIYNDILSCDFNFYENQINYPEICQKPILSPLAETAPLVYKFDLEGSFYEDSSLIYKIRVTPLFVTDAAFSGFLYIEDSTWLLRSVDLFVNKQALSTCKEFHLIQNYSCLDKFVNLPIRREINYVFKDGSSYILGNTQVLHSNYVVNKTEAITKWTNEIKSFDVEAFDRSEAYWAENRPVQMREKELNFIHVCDSLKAYFTSEEYYKKLDSSFNRISIWTPLVGIGRKNSFKKQQWYIEGLLGQVNPVGIGGYRHKLPGEYTKEFKNDFLLETDGMIDYGFNNKDIKGKIGAGLTYYPKKFVRTFIRAGDYYNMINNYASIAQTFSRSNYVRHVTFSISQRIELINGLFAEATFNYSDQRPINNLQLSGWSNELFGVLNKPIDFERYVKSEIVLELKYRIKQKYMYKGNKKIIFEAKHPVLTLKYKKGFPGLFGSEVNYDFIEIGASHHTKLKRWGSSNWRVMYGTYLNKTNLRVLEYKYFRGSDMFFFSNPTLSMQLLGSTKSTPNDYFQANYMHHFEGAILGKIPLINRLKLELAGGGGVLYIEDESFKQFEIFAGLERPITLWRQLMRIGVYAVTVDNNIDKADIAFKFGISFYNDFKRKWDY
ncbi:MAG: carboxypeptidase-like regulatory domain-containing protein [Flavobacteriales bacterium]|nr:carboxypeptidase-like regulatory domain-containing protein [Flavobacteriales bacterium]